jgi:hypothetical protein
MVEVTSSNLVVPTRIRPFAAKIVVVNPRFGFRQLNLFDHK